MPKVNDLKYLKHLARLGAVNIHPGGKRATTQLLANLSIMDGHHILDIGCGTGETMVRIASRRDVFITGIDVLPEMLEKAENRVKFSGLSDRIKVQPVSEGSPLPFSNERFDRVFTESAICFHDLNSARTLLNEIHRILKVHGIYAAN